MFQWSSRHGIKPYPLMTRWTPTQRNLLIAACIGSLCAILCFIRLDLQNLAAGDFSWSIRGAQLLWSGQNPYQDSALDRANPYPYNDPLFYPLPALFVATPFMWLPPNVAGALFVGLSVTLLCFGLSRDNWRLWPLLLSTPFWAAVWTVQWSPLVTAVTLLPILMPLTLAKPTIGLPLLLTQPSRRSWGGAALVMVCTLICLPSWPLDWFNNATTHRTFVPAQLLPGIFLLLAVCRWRDQNAWRLLLLALMPQRAIYDQLPLWLVAQTPKQALVLTLGSWVSLIGWWLGPTIVPQWIVSCMYLPALLIVLWPMLKPRWFRRIDVPASLTHRSHLSTAQE